MLTSESYGEEQIECEMGEEIGIHLWVNLPRLMSDSLILLCNLRDIYF